PDLPAHRIRGYPRLHPKLIAREQVEGGVPIIVATVSGAGYVMRFSQEQWKLLQLFNGDRSYGQATELFRQVIQLRGALRLGTAVDELRQTFEEAIGNGDTRMVINLSEVPMIDSSGIGLLVRFLAPTKQRGGNIKLVQPSKFAVQTLRLIGVLNLFEIFDN